MLRTNRLVVLVIAIVAFVVPSRAASGTGYNLDSVLDKTSREVGGFLDQFSDVKCTERVSQEKLSKKGHVEAKENSTFDYFVLLQGIGDDLTLSESRLEQKQSGKAPKNTSMLITNGFSTLFLIFHPYYRRSFTFDDPIFEDANGHHFMRVHFTHIPGRRTPAALAVRGREYPLDLTGDAWIDPASGMIARIEAHLANDMKDVGLVSLSVNVDYEPVVLPGWTNTFRFPVMASVDVESLRQRWRNVHLFTNYQRFMVDTQQTMSGANRK